MKNTSLYPVRHALHIKRISDFIFTAFLCSVLIVVLFYFFNKGAEYMAEIVVNAGPPESW